MLKRLPLLALLASPALASASVVLSQNFEGCTVDPGTAQVVVGSGTCGVSSVAVSGPTSTVNAVNVRSASNVINTATTNGFDGFFSSRFLVIGDTSGDITGNPNGGTTGTTSAITTVNFGLGAFDAGDYLVSVAFSYVFDTNFNGTSPDQFRVTLVDGASNQLGNDVLYHSSVTRNGSGTRDASFAWSGWVSLASSGNMFLRFNLDETPGFNSSAVGLDNLSVSVVSSPATLALAGLGLIGIAAVRRRAG